MNCRSGDLLAQEQVAANAKEQALQALGEASTRIREKLGESLASVRKFDAPAENVTTPSLEALRAYSLGYQSHVMRSDSAVAIPLYQRAIGLDPNFAMAYARLGTSYDNLGETAKAIENTRKAYDLRDRVSDREKLYIVSHYEFNVTGNLEAARRTYELSMQTYPRDEVPANNLYDLYRNLGDHEKDLTACKQALDINRRAGTGSPFGFAPYSPGALCYWLPQPRHGGDGSRGSFFAGKAGLRRWSAMAGIGHRCLLRPVC